MNFYNKNDFSKTLAYQFRITAKWRAAQAKRFPHDPRNAEASLRLLGLQSEINIPDDVWEQIEPLVSDPACLAVVSDSMRDVSFRKNPASFAEWLKNFRADLARV